MTKKITSPIALIRLCFLLSGFCSLFYQTAWLRLIVARFGVNAPVFSAVLSVFMIGLTLGTLAAGRWKKRLTQNPVRTGFKPYAILELWIAFGGLVFPSLLAYGASLITPVGMEDTSYFLLCFAVIFVLILPFSFAMGATLPVALALLERMDLPDKDARFSELYFINVVGAVYGVLGSAFIFFETLGFQKSLWLASATNVIIAILSWRYKPAAILLKKPAPEKAPSRKALNPAMLFVLFMLGLGSLALEVIWSRLYVLYTGSLVYAFASILATYLLMTALGTRFYRERLRASSPQTLALLWSSLPVCALLMLPACNPDLPLPIILRVLLGVAPVSFVTGILTPALIDRLTASAPDKVGIAYAANLAGCIVGPLVVGFWLIPAFGLQTASYLVAGLFCFPAVMGFSWEKPKRAAGIWLAVGFSILAIRFVDTSPETRFPHTHVLHDHTATVIAGGEGMKKSLVVGGTHMTALSEVTKLVAHLPLAFLDHQPEKGLLICFGMGTSFRSMASWGIETKAVELVPSVPKMFPYFYPDAQNFLSMPGNQIIVDDGRRFLSRTNETFDVISLDPPPPIESASSGLLYSKEIYALAKTRLKKNGILHQLIASGDDQDYLSILLALQESFSYVRMFAPYRNAISVVLASDVPIPNYTAKELAARLPEEAAKDLVEWANLRKGWFPKTPVAVFEHVLKSEIPIPQFIKGLKGNAVAMTDDQPVNEYYMLRQSLLPKSFEGNRIVGSREKNYAAWLE